MRDAYPEVASDYDRISRIAYAEEETFLRTLAQGTTILDVAVERAKQDGAPRSAATRRSCCTTPSGSPST